MVGFSMLTLFGGTAGLTSKIGRFLGGKQSGVPFGFLGYIFGNAPLSGHGNALISQEGKELHQSIHLAIDLNFTSLFHFQPEGFPIACVRWVRFEEKSMTSNFYNRDLFRKRILWFGDFYLFNFLWVNQKTRTLLCYLQIYAMNASFMIWKRHNDD